MTLADIMHRSVVTIDMDSTLERVRDIFDKQSFHHLVVEDAGRIVGVISDRDLLRHLSPFVGSQWAERRQDTQTLQRKAHQIMHRDVITAGPQTTADEAARLMISQNISCLPVVDGGEALRGIITIHDLLQAAYQ